MDALQQKKLNEAKTHIADAEKRYLFTWRVFHGQYKLFSNQSCHFKHENILV